MLFNQINENEPLYSYCSSLEDISDKTTFEVEYITGKKLKTNNLPEKKIQPEIKSIIFFTYKKDGCIKSAEKLDLKSIFN